MLLAKKTIPVIGNSSKRGVLMSKEIVSQDNNEKKPGFPVNPDLIRKELEKRYDEAAKLLEDNDEIERVLQRLEKKLADLPVVGGIFADVPVMISLVRSYIIKEYPDIPIGSIVAVVAGILYIVSPVDLIPDVTPGAGYLDDAGVVAICLALIGSDLDEYKEWRKANGKVANPAPINVTPTVIG